MTLLISMSGYYNVKDLDKLNIIAIIKSDIVDIYNKIPEKNNLIILIYACNDTNYMDDIIKQLSEYVIINNIINNNIINNIEHNNIIECKVTYNGTNDTYYNKNFTILIAIGHNINNINNKENRFIIPIEFLRYDNVIFTNNNIIINNQCPFNFTKGNVLYGNNIMVDSVLLFDSEDEKVFNFVLASTKHFDNLHDYKHALRVAFNATKILNTKLVLHLALLHDVCANYPESIPREELSKWIESNLPQYQALSWVGKYNYLDEMIEMISFSKQPHKKPMHVAIEAVRDANRIDALGEIGIDRCITYILKKGGKIPDDVIKHCYGKLLRLVPENYIVTNIGRELAKSGHNYIVDYVIEHMPSTNFRYTLPEKL